ncbi:hypothetical protein KUV65_06450 [Maritalea mobilis]|uniref:hypothetical protein n=1 Tax=Maritalea mobilis TaxID=483324 RepID=UPI001C95493C|nr:hypothetical protein [Maritalea mobilis]MBY6200996.1 hypothetical protein [Maritalea mobilis]
MTGADQYFGGVVSLDPLVTLSKRSLFHGCTLGIAPLLPEAMRARPALHLLALAWGIATVQEAEALADEISAYRQAWPAGRFLVLANTMDELGLCQRAGLPAIHFSSLNFVDESQFDRAGGVEKTVDAVYVAGLEGYKRHELARAIPSLRLLYWRPTAAALARVRTLLPAAEFYNHEIGDGAFLLLQGAEYARAVQGARVGLCLSKREGPMRASIEYQLLDLPVVTVESGGGRVEMMDPAYSRVVPPDPDAVADAVRDLVDRGFPTGAVRASVLERLASNRAGVVDLLRPHLREVFGDACDDLTFDDLGKVDLWRTRSSAAVLPEFDVAPV